MHADSACPGDGILALKLQWRQEQVPDGSGQVFPVIQADGACGLGWGGLWHVYWRLPEQEPALALALDAWSWNRILVSSACPTALILELGPARACGHWQGFFRNAGTGLNPARAIDDKLTTAGYVITPGPLPEPACDLYGAAVAALMSAAGTWYGAWKDGRCVGWVLAAFRGKAGVLLEALHVLEPWRHQGLATRLVETAVDGRAAWLLAGDTPSAGAFWADRGFAATGGYTLYGRDRD